MLIYRGWGILGVLLPIAAVLAMLPITSDDGNAGLETLVTGTLMGSVLSITAGVLLNAGARSRSLPLRDRPHSLFLVPLEWFGVLVAALTLAGYACSPLF